MVLIRDFRRAYFCVILIGLLTINGCYSSNQLSLLRPEAGRSQGLLITSLLCASGGSIIFDENGGRLEEYAAAPRIHGIIAGQTLSGPVRISLDTVLEIQTSKDTFDLGKTAGVVAASAGAAIIILLILLFSSFSSISTFN
jgi:hypothetical protein